MISRHVYSATLLEGAGYQLVPEGAEAAGGIVMDDSWAPHVQATLTIPIPSETVQELLDPREDRRIAITAERTTTPATTTQTRTWNLGLRDRTIDHAAATMTLTLASDEALLQDDVLLDDEPNVTALAYQSSIRSILNNVVLNRIGEALEAGAADAPFVVLSDSQNQIVNPTAQVDLSATTSAGLTSLVRTTGAAWSTIGGTAFRLNGSAGSSDSWFGVDAAAGALRNGMQAGKQYTVRGIFHLDAPLAGTALAGRARRIVLFTKVGAAAYVETVSAAAPNVAGDHLVSLTFTVPVGATEAFVRFYHGHASTSTAYWWALRLSEGTETGYFDGNTLDTDVYGYAWTGTPGSSTSTRLALIDRSPELLNWQPGESAWDFVQPLFQAAGLRLFCDEQRRWHLVDTTYTADGQTQLAYGVNLLGASDVIARDSDEWFDAALVRYRWLDADGQQQERYDFYAEPAHTRVRTFDINRAYPGPGFAEYAVRRALGRGRQIEATATSLYSSSPSQPVVITLPATPVQTGLIGRIEWDLTNDTMSLRSRGLTETPETAYIFGEPGISYLDVPVGMSYPEFEWSAL